MPRKAWNFGGLLFAFVAGVGLWLRTEDGIRLQESLVSPPTLQSPNTSSHRAAPFPATASSPSVSETSTASAPLPQDKKSSSLPASTPPALAPRLTPEEAFSRGPFIAGERSLDLIVTWLNSSAPAWLDVANSPGGVFAWSDYDNGFKSRQPYNPRGEDLSTNCVELKYCLRSLKKWGLMKYVRKIHIVHSDLYDPPNYLRKDHPRIQFVPHSVTFAHLPADVRAKGLPTFSRTAIDSQLHHIPDLADWFIRLDDDFFMTGSLVESHFWKGGKMQVYGDVIDPAPSPCTKGSDTYTGPMSVASCLLQQRFGRKTRHYMDHTPVMGFRPAIEEMEKIWPDRFQETASRTEDDPADIYWSALSTMYMVDTGRAEYTGRKLPPGFEELHTNAGHYCPRPCGGYEHDISDSRLENVKRFLDRTSKLKWVNLQGPGFDDAYKYRWNSKTREYSPKIEKIALEFWEKNYPTKNEFEV